MIHHDFQADNLLFGRASDSVPLVVIDWQMLMQAAVQWMLPICSSSSASRRPQAARARSRDPVHGAAGGSRGSGL